MDGTILMIKRLFQDKKVSFSVYVWIQGQVKEMLFLANIARNMIV